MHSVAYNPLAVMPARIHQIGHYPMIKSTETYRKYRQHIWGFASQVIVSGANFLTTLIILQTQGLGNFGKFSICFIVIVISRNFLTGIFLVPMSTIAPKLRHPSAASYRGFLALNVLVFAISSSALLLFAFLTIGQTIGPQWLSVVALPLAVANFASVGAEYVRRYLFVYERPEIACGTEAIRYSTQIIALAIFPIVGLGHSPEVALYATAVGGVSGSAFGVLFYGTVRWSKRLVQAIWPRHWNFIRWMAPAILMETIQANAPLLIGSVLIGEHALGLARAIQQLTNLLNLPTNALLQIAPSIATREYVAGGRIRLELFLGQMQSANLLYIGSISLVGAFFMFLYLKSGNGFDTYTTYTVFVVYTLMNICINLRLSSIIFFQVKELPSSNYWINMIGAVVAVAVPFSCKYIGVVGIPLAGLASVGISTLLFRHLRSRMIWV